jgi:hypothetical protein
MEYEMNVERLIQQFELFDTKSLDLFNALISSKQNEEIFPPYIPHIGNEYDKYKIMMYGMAQSISEPWDSLINMSRKEKVRQLYDAPTYRNIWIAPYKVMLSIAGMYVYANHGVSMEHLDDIHNCVSATNYYKFSLSKSGNDVNPDKDLSKHLPPDSYWKANDKLSMLELELLNPVVIISFNGRHNEEINQAGFNLIEINDPSWILQGGSGVLKETGRWYRKVDEPAVHRLVDSYLKQIDDKYSGKRDAVKIYLLKYYDGWKNP